MHTSDFSEKYQWIDLSFLRVYSAGNNDMIRKVIQTFLDKTPASMEGMEKQLAANDFHSLSRSMHSLKPQLSYLGITALTDIAVSIEECAKNMTETETIAGKLDEMKIILGKAFIELHEHLNSL
jgi:HPt (histidine-containing phosphotransfer) domain-containing protein